MSNLFLFLNNYNFNLFLLYIINKMVKACGGGDGGVIIIKIKFKWQLLLHLNLVF